MDRQDTKTITTVYRIGLVLFVPLVLVFFFLRTDLAMNLLIKNGRMCSILKATGYPCPGCGGTRASFFLSRFMFINSIKMNASVLCGTLFYLIFMVVETLHFKFKTKGFSEKGFFVLLYTFVAVILIQWILKVVGL